MTYRILSIYDENKVLWGGSASSAAEALSKAMADDANLRGADLRDANLRGANLRGANLRGADLGGANLRGADLGGANLSDVDLGGANLRFSDLSDANLRDADLRDADLREANLSEANLRDADLRDADLGGANLSDANLRGANLSDANLREANLRFSDLGGANLSEANLSPICGDFYRVLKLARNEVPGLYTHLLDGKVEGSHYEGDCACLVGTIANIKEVSYLEVEGLNPNSERPSEKWFLAIRKGDTPENNPISAIVKDWIEDFCKENNIKLPARRVVWE